MSLLNLFRRRSAGRVRRPRLSFEALESRETPTDFLSGGGGAINLAPVIDEFDATETLAGYYTFFGHVTDENPEGMVIYFGGGTSTMPGQSVTVNADGSFFFSIQLQTNGSDAGSVEAWTIDNQGVVSQIASVEISPANA